MVNIELYTPTTLSCCHKALQGVHQILNFREPGGEVKQKSKGWGVEVVSQRQAEVQKMYSFLGKSDHLSEPWFSFLFLFETAQLQRVKFSQLLWTGFCMPSPPPLPPTQNIYILNPHSQCLRMWLHLEVGSLNRYVCTKPLQSCPTLCDSMDCSPPGSSAHGIFQARILEWVVVSFSRGSSRPRDQTRVSLQPDSLLSEPYL